MKRYYEHLGRDIFVTSGSAKDLPPGAFGVCAIGGGAEGWSIVHIGPDGDAADLGGEYYFGTPEEALAFVRELIGMMQTPCLDANTTAQASTPATRNGPRSR